MLLNAFNRFVLTFVFVAYPATVGEVGFLGKLQNKFAVASDLPLILPHLHKASCARDMAVLSLLSWYWTTIPHERCISSPLGMTKGQWPTFKTIKVTPNPIKWSDEESSRVFMTQLGAEVILAQAILPGTMPGNCKSGSPKYLKD